MKKTPIPLLILFWYFAGAQSPSYLHYGTEEGLPGNLIYCALEDSQGYLWFGTDKGLARFDGEHFITYSINDGLPDTEVINLFEDTSGRLWVGCFGQKAAFRYKGRFYSLENDSLLKKISLPLGIPDFFEEKDGTFWLTGGVITKIRHREIHEIKKNLFFKAVRKIDNNLFGITGDHLYRIDSGGNITEAFSFGNNWAYSYFVNGNRLLFTFSNHTQLIEFKNDRFEQIASAPFIFQAVYVDRNGRFWGSFPGKGAVCFDNSNKNLSNPVWYLSGKKVNNVYEDSRGNFWFLTHGEGLFLLPRQYATIWQKQNGLYSSNIQTLALDAKGRLLAGDDLGNVYRFSDNKQISTYPLGVFTGINLVRQILPLENDQFWAVADAGFFFYSSKTIKNHDAWGQKGRHSGAPKSIAKSDHGLWMGSSKGTACLSPQAEVPIIHSMGRATVLATDHNDMVWKGSVNGLYNEKDNFSFNWGDVFPLLKSRIVAIQKGRKDQLWVITVENGLIEVLLNSGKIEATRLLNNRLSHKINNIKNIRVMPDGKIWAATNKGVFLIDEQLKIVNYTIKHGLPSNEINDIIVQTDTLWVATANGLSILALNKYDTSGFRTVLTTFKFQTADSLINWDFHGRADAGQPKIRIPHNARLPEVIFAGLGKSPGDVLHFQHIKRTALLPFPWFTFDNIMNWAYEHILFFKNHDTITLNTSSLNIGTNITPGKYHYQSVSIAFNGKRGIPVSWELTVLPHWSQTIWLRILIITAIAGIFWRFYRMRTLFFHMENSLLQLKLQALRSQINPHFIGNSINAVQKFFYPPNPEKASDYIYLFNAILRKTLFFSEKDFISFSEEYAFDQEYLKMVQLRYPDSFHFEITGAENIPPSTLFPTMFLQPVLENATIHGLAVSGVSLLKIHFFLENKRLICLITDNGMGINESKERKKNNLVKRPSKGIELLKNKAFIINRVHSMDIRLEWVDLKDIKGPEMHGTQVEFSFTPTNING